MKLPYMQFYVADYLVDTAPLSLAAQGAWMRVLCSLHTANPRGKRTMTVEAWARYLSVTPSVTEEIFAELRDVGVCDFVPTGNAGVTLVCRRMLREDITKEQTRIRVRNHRLARQAAYKKQAGNAPCNDGGNAEVTGKKSEVRSQKSEIPPKPPTGAEESEKDTASLLPAIVPPPRGKGPLQLRAERLMRRRESTPLTAAESRALSKNRAAIEATTEQDWRDLEAFYAAPQDVTFARKDLAALLNNWNGEIDRAKAWVAKHRAPAGVPVASQTFAEPVGWREFVALSFPDCPYAPGQSNHGAEWSEVQLAHQRMIIEAMSREGGK